MDQTAQRIRAAIIIALTASCGGGGKGPTQPTTPAPTITAISPSSGPSIGGTEVTITGSNFSAGMSLTIGGAQAQSVTIVDSMTITAKTPSHAGGVADVVVSAGTVSAMLPAAYTFEVIENPAPVIYAITARGTRRNEPPNFADLDEEIDLMATLADDQTPLDQLTYEWTAESGTFSGSGPSVKWRAPGSLPKTPVDEVLTLTVIEKFQTTDDAGAVVERENKALGKVTVHIHNSIKEVGDLATEFLTAFSNSAVPADVAVRNFSDDRACGRVQELSDIQDNRAKYVINSSSLGPPAVTFNFASACQVDRFGSVPGDACARLACGWKSTLKANGRIESVSGTCTLSEIYEDVRDRWRLCWSEFRGTNVITGAAVKGLNFRSEP